MLNLATQPSTFKTKYCVEINDELHGTYGTSVQIKTKTAMLCQVFLIIEMHSYMLKEP